MARLHDGRVIVHLTVRMAWWVRPHLFAMKAFLWSIAPFLDDDERLECFITRQAEFIVNHGLRFEHNGKRV